jgi:hypothetical protein
MAQCTSFSYNITTDFCRLDEDEGSSELFAAAQTVRHTPRRSVALRLLNCIIVIAGVVLRVQSYDIFFVLQQVNVN